MITQNFNLTHGAVDNDRVFYRNSKGEECRRYNTTLEKCIAWEKKQGNSILWYELNYGERVSLG